MLRMSIFPKVSPHWCCQRGCQWIPTGWKVDSFSSKLIASNRESNSLFGCCVVIAVNVTDKWIVTWQWWSYIGYQFLSVSLKKLCCLMHGVVHGHAPEYVVDMVVPVSHLQADHICDQLNAATSTFHAHGLPSDIDRSLLLLHWPGMNYQLTSASSWQLLHSRNTSRQCCLWPRIPVTLLYCILPRIL